MNEAVDRANSKVLFNPMQSPAIVGSRNHVATDVHEFHGLLGIEASTESSEARRWKEAAGESWDKARETGAQGLGSVKQFGSETGGKAKSATGKTLATGASGVDSAKQLGSAAGGQVKAVKGKLSGLAGRRLRRRGDEETEVDPGDEEEHDEQGET